jgi:glutamyl-tRNA synthetase
MQFQRVERHREAVEELLKRGNAYRCYCTPDDLDAMRKQAEAEGKPPIYNGLWRDRDPSEAPAGVKPAIRLKTPRSGETVIEDQVQGRVVFQNENLDDLIILRSDGTPTYNLAVVVDDHDMGVTHVIRGVDHLTNAARQTQIYLGLGWEVPSFSHVPLIHGPDGAKLSKRHGALGVEAYRAMGYLPAALRNYLVRLGWSHGNEEIIPLDKMVEWFDLDGVGRSPARFDFAKLEDLNGHYIRQTPESELLDRIRQALPEMENGAELEAKFAAAGWDKLAAALPSLKQRAKTLRDLVDGASYVIAERPLPLDDKAAKLLSDDARALLTTLLPRLEAAEWTATSIEAEVRRFAEETGAKLGSVAQPLRAALTGRSVSPPVFDVMAVLGRDEALARIRDQAAGP